ncbi:MAG: hypothetical protein U0638_17175 [Phycisphaerales bacterium]
MSQPTDRANPPSAGVAPRALSPRTNAVLVALCWLAKLSGLAVGVTLPIILFASREQPKGSEWLGVAFFPLGVSIGLLLGIWRELLGGAIAILSLAMFYFMFVVVGKTVPKGPYFAIFTSPALLLLIAGLIARRCRHR